MRTMKLTPIISFVIFLSAISAADEEAFLNCLLHNSHPSNPIASSIFPPQNPSYSSVLQSYFRNFRLNETTTPKPFLILNATHESHVQAAVVCAKNYDLQMKIRSGGHDYDGLSYRTIDTHVPFFVLDMFNLREINIDISTETAWVQSGAILGEVYYKVAEKSKVHGFPSGVCPTVGVEGHLSGGGYGNMMRKYGLTVDNVIDARFVDVNGRLHDRESMGEDLFWAIRGGAASFGIVIAYKINLVHVLASLLSYASPQDLDNFLQCLSNHSDASHPISEATYISTNPSFESVLLAYSRNLRFTSSKTRKPLAIITAQHESHVQATVICANKHGLQIRIRSGGHDYEGLSYVSNVPFIVLDMFNLRAINIANNTAWVQTGATLGELYYHIANTSQTLAFPAGVCPSVGTGGHFSGGGYGNMMRKFGLSVDNIVDALIVNVDGKVLDRASMGEDLFWAIRGGGGASFGVILAWKISLVQIPPKVTVFEIPFTINQGAVDVLYQWQHIAPELPGELFIRPMIVQINGTVTVNFIGFFLGDADQLIQLTIQSFPELNLTYSDCKETSWLNSTIIWAEYPEGTSPESVLLNRTLFLGPRDYFQAKSDYVRKVIPREGVKSILEMLKEVGMSFMQWNPYGGRMSEIPESSTPFPHRAGVLFKIQYGMTWYHENATRNRIEASRRFYAMMTPYVSEKPREAFLNYRDLDIGKRSGGSNITDQNEGRIYGVKFFKENFERLRKIKARVDPHNFFTNEQSITPS